VRAVVTRPENPVRDPLLARWLRPQDYSADRRYRPPSRRYGRISRWVGVPLTSLGLAPRYAVTLEVPGRRSGKPRRTPVLVTPLEGEEYLVALAGESEWVRNVRAAHGVAVLHRRGARRVLLEEVPLEARARVLAAYQAAGAERSGPNGARVQARYNFGLGPEPTPADFERLAPRYPVFRITDRGATAGAHINRSPTEIAPGVFCIGPWGRTATTAYLVTTPTGWVLLDTGWAGDVDRIRDAAARVYGGGSAPTAILLTHVHSDHSGAARALAQAWTCPVYLHPAELPVATGDFTYMH
jgi:deazaflavin-dependent oxidoreductase (nitroreductase family)